MIALRLSLALLVLVLLASRMEQPSTRIVATDTDSVAYVREPVSNGYSTTSSVYTAAPCLSSIATSNGASGQAVVVPCGYGYTTQTVQGAGATYYQIVRQ